MEQANDQQAKLYSPLQSVLFAVGIYFLSQISAGIIVAAVPLARHWSVEQVSNWLQENAWATAGYVACVEAITLYCTYWLLKRRKLSFGSLGFKKPRGEHILYALGGFAVYFVVYIVGIIIAQALIPSLDLNQKQEIGFSTTTSGLALLPAFLSLVVLPPITEEIVARGFLFGGLRTKLAFIPAAVITSLLFASAHLGEGSGGLLWVAGIDTFILSIVLCYLREKTGSLWPSIGLHMIKNGLAFFVIFNIAQYIR